MFTNIFDAIIFCIYHLHGFVISFKNTTFRTRSVEMEDLVGTQQLFLKAANHAANYRDNNDRVPHRPSRNYADSVDEFSEDLPENGLPEEEVLDLLVAKSQAGLHLMTGPRFMGWVIGGSHPMGVAADFLTSAWGQNAGNHTATPSAAAVEKVVAKWLLDILHLPAECSVGFVTGATSANFTCLAAARGEVLRRAGWNSEANGLFGAPPITVLIGDDAHTTVFADLQLLGLGHDRVVRLKTDDQGKVTSEAFSNAIAHIDGPCVVILQAGQINTGAFDDFAGIIPQARAKRAWVHVDGAFGLWAQASPAKRHLSVGIDLADSWATDGHKWLQTPYDSGYAIVRDEAAHRRAVTFAASYLPPTAEGERDPSHYVPELSRRARGFATWAMIKHLGRSGIELLIDNACEATATIAEALSRVPGILIGNDVVLNQVIVRFGVDLDDETSDKLTVLTIGRLQREGVIFVGGAIWRGRQIMRVSICNYQTDREQALVAVETIKRSYRVERKAMKR